MSNSQTTVVGYYNGHKWPIQLVISRLNITLHLQPGEYILNRDGVKINDPSFETYAENSQLSREIADAPVPLVLVPVPQALPTSASAFGHAANPVRATSKFALDSQGIRRPVMPALVPQAALAQNHTPAGADPVTPMTMEEARKRGLVRRVREVPEDYGVTDTAGAPPRTMPGIKYAIDPSMLKKAPPLPSELMKVESKEVSHASTRTQLITQMAQGASAPATPESANVFLNQTSVNAPPNSPIVSGPALPRSVVRSHPAVQPPPPPPEPEPEMTEEEMAAAENGTQPAGLPPPDLSELESQEPAPESQIESQEQTPPTALKPVAKRDRYICAGCGLPFKFRSQLEKHAAAKHRATFTAIMTAYPPEE